MNAHRAHSAGLRSWRSLLCLLGLLLVIPGLAPAQQAVVPNSEAQQAKEAEAQRQLDRVRRQIAELVVARNALDAQRGDATRALREADQRVAEESRALEQINGLIQDQEVELRRLEAERVSLGVSLGAQREALASLLRSAYVLGRHERLKLLLAQDRVESLARVLAYHRYFQRGRVERIDQLLDALQELAKVVERVHELRAALETSQAQQQTRVAALEEQRGERRRLVADLDTRFRDTENRLATLGRDEQSLVDLLERLQDIFADIPDEPEATQPFAKRRGQLTLPLRGSVLSGFGGTLPDGRTSHGWLLAAEVGTPVQAIAHGRVVFADWLKGYGLIVILDHGGGYMSLYAYNDNLRREVGDWVDAGDTLAGAGTSGGQSRPALYLELRRDGRPIDPKGWFISR